MMVKLRTSENEISFAGILSSLEREEKGLACVHDEMRCDTRGYRVLLLRQKVFHSRRASEVEDSIWSEGKEIANGIFFVFSSFS